PAERVGILVINFGEPDEPVPEKVEPFLERIFLQNAGLEPDEEQRARARQLARDRTPGLIEEYESIGGSPLNAQAEAQARALEDLLRARGWDARSYPAYQFTSPAIAEQVAAARADGVDVLVALPIYPLCGQSTTVAAVDPARMARGEGGDTAPRFIALSGWHPDSGYVAFRTEHVRRFIDEHDLDVRRADTLLY